MNSKLALVSLAVLVCVAIHSVAAKDTKHQCLGVDLKFDEAGKKAWKECHKAKKETESGEGGKEPHDHCAMDCLYRKLELINSEGKLDATKLEAAFKKTFPEAAQAGIIKDNKKCMEEVTEKLTTDDNCKGFQKYSHCHFKSIKEHCTKKE